MWSPHDNEWFCWAPGANGPICKSSALTPSFVCIYMYHSLTPSFVCIYHSLTEELICKLVRLFCTDWLRYPKEQLAKTTICIRKPSARSSL